VSIGQILEVFATVEPVTIPNSGQIMQSSVSVEALAVPNTGRVMGSLVTVEALASANIGQVFGSYVDAAPSSGNNAKIITVWVDSTTAPITNVSGRITDAFVSVEPVVDLAADFVRNTSAWLEAILTSRKTGLWK
jgi:hypothetical protein